MSLGKPCFPFSTFFNHFFFPFLLELYAVVGQCLNNTVKKGRYGIAMLERCYELSFCENYSAIFSFRHILMLHVIHFHFNIVLIRFKVKKTRTVGEIAYRRKLK